MTFSDQTESFLTVAEVAGLLKLNQQTVRNWIDQGSLPAVRVGRRVRIKQSDLQRVIDAGYQGAPLDEPRQKGPSADDFWGGEPVGMAEIDPSASSVAWPPAPGASQEPGPPRDLSASRDPGAPPGASTPSISGTAAPPGGDEE